VSRRPTIADVARTAGVSPSTASVVYSGKTPVSEATRARVLAAAAQLGYTGPDPRAASLRRGRSGVIGVVMHGRIGDAFRDPVLRRVMDGLADALAPIGAGILMLRETSVVSEEPTLLTAPIDGAVLIGCSGLLREHLGVVQARGIPVVVVEGDAGPGVPRVVLDNVDAQRQAALHLRALGHSRVAAVTLPVRWGSNEGWIDPDSEPAIAVDVTRDRLSGFRDVYPDAPAFAAGESSIDAGLTAGRALLADAGSRPTAVVAQSDLLAAGIIRAAEEAGLRVPEDLSVTGFDGIEVDGLLPYELTTLVQPATEKGRRAGSILAALLHDESPGSHCLTSAFREGNTTAPPGRAAGSAADPAR
jgi:DNA-binding LacI/PurR family transcriptional regulator